MWDKQRFLKIRKVYKHNLEGYWLKYYKHIAISHSSEKKNDNVEQYFVLQ